MEEIDNAEQYALLASLNGYYPCYACPNGQSTIFYIKAKYGDTALLGKVKKGRYANADYKLDSFSELS